MGNCCGGGEADEEQHHLRGNRNNVKAFQGEVLFKFRVRLVGLLRLV